MTRVIAAACVAVSLACLWACNTAFDPRPVDEVGFLTRAETRSEKGVTVTTAVPSRREAGALFGTDLYRRGVQPIWLEIENQRDEMVAFLPVGLDPEYFTPIEAANIDLGDDAGQGDPDRNRYFFQNRMTLYIGPGETRKGFVFSQLDEGTKAFNVDIVSDTDSVHHTFFIPVPGLKLDHHRVDWESLYSEDQIVELDEGDEDRIIELLESLPCCTTDKKGRDQGDPLNIVVIGSSDDVYYSFIRAGWDETETIHRGSLWKTVSSFFSGGEYRYSPVSGLYVFGRPQDVAFQKARDNIHERNHLRLWLSPYLYAGQLVWIGQISRDIGVRFTKRTITTHKIDPDVDETREFLLEDLAYAQSLARIAYVEGVGAAPYHEPRGNLTGDPYFTDGLRVVLWVTGSPVEIDDIAVTEWRIPTYELEE